MLGNKYVRMRRNDGRVHALTAPVAPSWLPALLLFTAALLGARAAFGGRSSCPLTSAVVPFEASANARYEIELTDGGAGDLDGTANGECAAAVRLCRGETPLCDSAVIDDIRVRALGGTSPFARELAEEHVTAAADTATNNNTITAGDACGVARVTLAAEEDASTTFRFRVAAQALANGRRMARRSRLTLRCRPASGGPSDPQCYTSRGDCPPIAGPVCGNGVVEAGERCDGSDAEACADACTATCTCPSDPTGPGTPEPPRVPTCGDGARNQDEERCDGTDDSLCPTGCRADCTCGTTSGDLNIAGEAVAEASTDVAESTAHAAIDGVVDGLPGEPTHEWSSNGEGPGAWLRLTWPSPVTIDQVILHDRPNDVDNVLDAALIMDDDGEPVQTGSLPADGAPVSVMIGTRTIVSLTFVVMEATGTHAGLAEIEAVKGQKSPPPPASTPTYYMSPSGDDGASGKTADQAWKTFSKALPALEPGDTLILGDGTYTRSTTGLPSINCASGGNAKNGTADQPITVRAQNERKAFLSSDGQQSGLAMRNCSWWNVEGLRAANTDSSTGDQLAGYPFRFDDLDHVNLRRLLGSHNNRMQNTHVYAVENSEHVLLEECEAYFYHRHAFSIWRSRYVTIRRCYANSMRYGSAGCCSTIDNRSYGDEAYSIYGTSDSVIENSISENQANGFQIHGIANPLDPSGSGGRRNRVLGSISLNDSVPALVSSRVTGGTYHNARDNVFRDFVAANMGANGIFLRGAANTIVENATLYDSSGNSGLSADDGDSGLGGSCGSSNTDGCSFTARNVLALGNKVYGVHIDSSSYKSWLVEYSDAAGNGSADYSSSETPGDDTGGIQRSQRTAAPGTGLGAGQCLLWAPQGSWLKGSGKGGVDIGATIARRYVDGQLTTTPLWDPGTGAFPCGATVAGINDGDTACRNIHTRLNANVNGCPLP